jgi:hypothetical protein
MAIPMPLTTQEKGERFQACPSLGNNSALFAFNVCSKTNHGERLAAAARGCTAISPLAIIGIGDFDRLADGGLCRMLADAFH